jgi:hypothetical protein
MGIRNDLAMLSTAIRGNYPITQDMRQKWVNTANELVVAGKPREQLAALRVLILMDQLNKKEERESFGDAILGIAERLGIRNEVEGTSQARPDQHIERVVEGIATDVTQRQYDDTPERGEV